MLGLEGANSVEFMFYIIMQWRWVSKELVVRVFKGSDNEFPWLGEAAR